MDGGGGFFSVDDAVMVKILHQKFVEFVVVAAAAV
jgi:hypothetical protein